MVLIIAGRRMTSLPDNLETFFQMFPEIGEKNAQLTKVQSFIILPHEIIIHYG